MRDFTFDRLFKDWRKRIEFEIYYGVGLLNKFEISPTDQRLRRRVKRMEPRFMKLTHELEWIAERIEEHPRYP